MKGDESKAIHYQEVELPIHYAGLSMDGFLEYLSARSRALDVMTKLVRRGYKAVAVCHEMRDLTTVNRIKFRLDKRKWRYQAG